MRASFAAVRPLLSRPLCLLPLPLCLALLAAPSVAVAQDLSAADEARRTKIFEAASDDYGEGRWSDAATKLERVVEMRRSSQALRALALVEKELGRLVSAKAHAAEALSLARGQSDEEPACKKALEVIAPLVPKVAVHLPAALPDARIRVDSIPATAAGGILEVDPGKHTLRVEAPDHEPFEEVIEVAAGSSIEVDVVLRPSAPPTRPQPTSSRVPWIAGGVSLLALGAAGVSVGVFGASQIGEAGGRLSGVCSGQYCPPGYAEYVDQYDTGRSLAIAGFVAAGVGLLGGTALLVFSPSAPAGTPPAASRVHLFAGPSSLGVTGTF